MLVLLYYSCREFGILWTLRRAWVEICIRIGIYTFLFPRRKWRDQEFLCWVKKNFFFSPESLFLYWKNNSPKHFVLSDDTLGNYRFFREWLGDDNIKMLTVEAETILNGDYTYFFKHKINVGFPPKWHQNPFMEEHAPNTAHWSRIPAHCSVSGDIKYVWELGRFAAAYTLARAYAATGNDAYPEYFWQMVESWGEYNPPNYGVHWRCGQEIAIRLMAWVFALYVFKDSPHTTPIRFVNMLGMIAVQADRLAGTTLYAHLQDNNHSISEGAGLWTVGVLFPMLKKAEKWRQKGQRILENDARRLIRDDGSFSQKSTNYHRLMLQNYLYAFRLGDVNGYAFRKDVVSRLRAAGDFLLQMIDPVSGWGPNCGGNDGALIMPLNRCDYNDMRPVAAAVHYYFYREKIFEDGPWHEDLFWFFGKEAVEKPPCPPTFESFSAKDGGFHTIRGIETWAMLRCGAYLSRPSQPDCLHVDLWWRGRNIAMDPGTYLYYAQDPWSNGLQATRFHNTVCVDELDQLEQGPGFMWIRWHDAKISAQGENNEIAFIEGEHDGYCRLNDPVRHKRCLVKVKDVAWLAIDDLWGRGIHEFSLQWLLSKAARNKKGRFYKLSYPEGDMWFSAGVINDNGFNDHFADWLDHADESDPRGWFSRYYGHREQGMSIRLYSNQSAPIRFLTVFSTLRWSKMNIELNTIELSSHAGTIIIRLKDIGSNAIFYEYAFNDSKLEDKLEVKGCA